MSSTELVRWGGLAGALAGAMYMLSSIMDLFSPQEEGLASFPDYLAEAVFFVALLFTLGAMVGLHALQKGRYGRLGAVGFLTAFVGGSLLLLGSAALILTGREEALAFAIPSSVGLLAMLVGLVLLGAATLRARVLPRWCGVLLIVGLPVGFVLLVILAALGVGGMLLNMLLGVLFCGRLGAGGVHASRG